MSLDAEDLIRSYRMMAGRSFKPESADIWIRFSQVKGALKASTIWHGDLIPLWRGPCMNSAFLKVSLSKNEVITLCSGCSILGSTVYIISD